MWEPLSEGTFVGRYRVGALLRERPGARLYAVHGGDASRPITLTLLAPRGPEEMERLGRRAELLKGVDHRGVASVLEVGRYGDGELFVARERVDGRRLDELVSQPRRIEAAASVEIVRQVAEALAALRRKGMSYVDVGPRDVVVDLDAAAPRAWVADLGLTREQPEGWLVAPEVRTGQPRDERSDVYALGALLVTELTGGDDGARAPVERAALPGALDRVVARAIADDPGERYATPAALVRAAQKAIDPRLARPIRRQFRPSGETTAGAPSEDATETASPHRAYALLDTPETVVAGAALTIHVGLTPSPDPRRPKDVPFDLPPLSGGPYPLAVHVKFEGFILAEGQSPRAELTVDADHPFPKVPLRLIAEPLDGPFRAGCVWATYSVRGKTLGTAVRPVGIARSPDLEERARPDDPGGTTKVAFTSAWEPPDLTVNVVTSDSHTLHWSFESRHQKLVTDETHRTSLGSAPETFAKGLLATMPLDGIAGFRKVDGAGARIARAMPAAVWPLLRAVAERAEGAPTVLINSDETYVPWELARLPEPLTAERRPYLGVQAVVGRWVAGMTDVPEPPLRPDLAERLTVVWGRYASSTSDELRAAEEEAADLEVRYGARRVGARLEEVDRLLADPDGPDILHFAMHARGIPGSISNGLVLEDGGVIDTTQLASYGPLQSRPLVFLNACEAAGVGDTSLGRAAGIAATFLEAGACGVIAPVWEVDDVAAKDLVTRFYAEAFGSGIAIADHLREERATFSEATPSTTPIAYLFFGHPAARLRAVRSGRDG
jgi:hypothetical protein